MTEPEKQLRERLAVDKQAFLDSLGKLETRQMNEKGAKWVRLDDVAQLIQRPVKVEPESQWPAPEPPCSMCKGTGKMPEYFDVEKYLDEPTVQRPAEPEGALDFGTAEEVIAGLDRINAHNAALAAAPSIPVAALGEQAAKIRERREQPKREKELERVLHIAHFESGCDGDLCTHSWHEEAARLLGDKRYEGPTPATGADAHVEKLKQRMLGVGPSVDCPCICCKEAISALKANHLPQECHCGSYAESERCDCEFCVGAHGRNAGVSH